MWVGDWQGWKNGELVRKPGQIGGLGSPGDAAAKSDVRGDRAGRVTGESGTAGMVEASADRA